MYTIQAKLVLQKPEFNADQQDITLYATVL